MDKIRQYIADAQEKTREEKHSIAVLGAGAVTGVIFTVWLIVFFYTMPTTSVEAPGTVQSSPTADQAPAQRAPTDSAQNATGDQNNGQSYEIPAIYRPDSSTTTSQTPETKAQIDTQVSTPERTTNTGATKGSEGDQSVVQ